MGKQGQHQEKELKSCSNWSKVVGQLNCFESAELAEMGLTSIFVENCGNGEKKFFLSFIMPASC